MDEFDETTTVADPAERLAREAGAERRDRAYLIVLAGSNVGAMYRLQSEEVLLGRGGDADLRVIDDGVSRLHCRIRVREGQVQVEDLKSRNGTFLNGERIASRPLRDGDKLQLGRTTILKFTYHDELDETFQRHLYDSALRDGLTRAFNKRYFTERLKSEFRFALRHNTRLALFLFDLDHFKKLNDTYGHLAGDKVLVAFTEHIQNSIRNEDVLARYGGEEFAMISRAIPRADAHRLGDRLRREIAELEVRHDGQELAFTCSVGVATLPEDPCESPEDLIAAADRALYAAKAAGRDRVEFAETIRRSDGET